MDPSEVDFLSEEQMITILPNFREGRMYLISGDLGPFEPGMPTEAPLWMAINLKCRKKCRIVAPDWMNVEQLREKRDEAKEMEYFTKMPNECYLEMTSLLLNSARDDIPHANEVQNLVKDIWEIRMAKMRKSMNIMVQEKETHARLDNLTRMEINTVRPFLTSSLNHMHKLRCYVAEHPRTGTGY
ncbi:DNA replication complex GINS protein PSF2-like [Xenia sp. Carnegie-2017]|uniref:DNA replication complex GINS protein PSF2-like n=1 Tax=Xenia sp. Carnegie-2017 TaxID=2897299 RepID=UPI001F03DB1A|nr:DNA replication complex GINS protein PSF2-like [Xenia sp. Carnegie-2017]